MATEALERAFESTRQVLSNVQPNQLDDPTPCQSWDVRALINHIVGGSHWFAATVEAGQAPAVPETDYAAGDFVGSYEEGTRKTIAAFNAEGALDKTLTLPFGQFPGAMFLGLVTVDQFTHGWDLARATGQSTDLDPELAGQLIGQTMIPDAFRGADGVAPFGLAQDAPEGACGADRLAALLGRSV
jgi:uncharacterized protein (TIGR03086 family)